MKHTIKVLLSKLFFAGFLFLICTTDLYSQSTCTSSGNWSSAAIWTPAAPIAGQSVNVAAGCTLYVDITTVQISDITVDGVLIINANGISILNMAGNISVSSGAVIENHGKINLSGTGRIFTLAGSGTYIHNPFTNTSSDESIFYNSNENFSPLSNLSILKWYNGTVPLGDLTRVQSSNFGNVLLSANVPGGIWDQDGRFSLPTPARIRGSLTISKGIVVMDDGTGSTTNLVLQNVLINNTGSIVFQRGGNRNLTLTTGSFTLSSVAPAAPSVVLDTSYGILNWTVNGNLSLAHDFSAVYSGNFSSGIDIRITVNGNMVYTGGNVNFINKADSPLRLSVSGTTTLNNTTGSGNLSFIEGGSGTLNFTTNDFNLISGNNICLLGAALPVQQYKGIGNFTVNNDLNVSGIISLHFAICDSNLNKIRINVSRDINFNSAATIHGAYTSGAFTLKAGRNLTVNEGKFVGQSYTLNTAIDSIITGSNFLFNSSTASDYFIATKAMGNTFFTSTLFTILNSGTSFRQGIALADSCPANLTFSTGSFIQNGGQFCGISAGSGTLTFNCTGMVDVNAGIFRAVSNTIYSNPGNLIFTAGSIDYDGGTFSGYYACNNAGSASVVTINGVCKINFNTTTDEFTFIGLPQLGFDINNISLNLTISGLLNITGANGTFVSSKSLGSEVVSLNGINISSGNNSFNNVTNSPVPNGHNVTMLVSNNITISGGNTYLSGFSQTYTGIVNGNVSITDGKLSVKGGDCTTSTLNILGSFTLTNGEFYIHNAINDELPASSTITVSINSNDDNTGDFTHTGGLIVFDNALTTPAALNIIMNIKSPVYTIGGTGSVTMTKPGTGLVYGHLNFARTGTISFNRSGSHQIQQIRQSVLSGCTLDIVSGNMQIASNNSISTPPEFLWVNAGSILNARSASIFSNALNTNSGITVLGRLRTQHPNGLYNATVNATFSTTLADNLDFFLATTSTIEYYASGTQQVTGTGIGKAIAGHHKYGILEINNTGLPNVEFAYPVNNPHDSAVSVRNVLMLTAGEFNLDDDHNSSNGGGRILVLESQFSTAMQRTSGYVRCESDINTSLIKWNILANAGPHIFHIGYSSTEYIPFTFHHVSGNSGSVYLGTYHTAFDNLPLPPTVTHVRNNLGLDNSANTVDRFWYLKSTGTTFNSNFTFTATPTEVGSITNLQSQRWILPALGWAPPSGVQNSLPFGNITSGIQDVTNWWTLSGNSSPLPVELISFTATCFNKGVNIEWKTASEINNDYFIIEKSLDGINFDFLNRTEGNGTISFESHYQITDIYLFEDFSYYRLKQFDFDGNLKSYDPIAINCTANSEGLLSFELSNMDYGVSLNISNIKYNNLSIVIVDLYGKEIYKIDTGNEKDITLSLSKENFAAGIYFATVKSDNESITQKFFIE